MSFNYNTSENGRNSSWSLGPSVAYKMAGRFSSELGLDWSHNVTDNQWFGNYRQDDGTHYTFAHLDQTTTSATVRLNYTFTPAVSLQAYVQPFVSAGSYADYKELARPGTYEFNRYGAGQISYDEANSRYVIDPDGAGSAPSFTVSQPNFNVRSLRGNAVMRWDYRPGSSLYFVWQQERSGFEPIGDFDGRRDVDAIFRTIPRNVFLAKATYWMGK